MGDMRYSCEVLLGKPKGNRPHRRRREDKIKMNVNETEWEEVTG
jgi:hypothetical protein